MLSKIEFNHNLRVIDHKLVFIMLYREREIIQSLAMTGVVE